MKASDSVERANAAARWWRRAGAVGDARSSHGGVCMPSSAGERAIRLAVADARRAMHPRHAALTQDVHAKLSGAIGRLADTQIHGKNATPRKW